MDKDVPIVPISEARRRLSELVEDLAKPDGEPVVISVRGRPSAVLVSVDDFSAYAAYLQNQFQEDLQKTLDQLEALTKSLAKRQAPDTIRHPEEMSAAGASAPNEHNEL